MRNPHQTSLLAGIAGGSDAASIASLEKELRWGAAINLVDWLLASFSLAACNIVLLHNAKFLVTENETLTWGKREFR